ncbi:hypothetical protein Bca101_011161 [Brassica carinata]
MSQLRKHHNALLAVSNQREKVAISQLRKHLNLCSTPCSDLGVALFIATESTTCKDLYLENGRCNSLLHRNCYCSPREIGIQYKRMGIDIQRIVKIESLPLEHFCLVCQLLINPNEALQSMCGHLYCKPCLTYIASTTRTCPYDGYLVTESYAKPLVESNKVLADAIGKTLVYCSYQESGCTWVGSLADSSFHCSGCAFGNSHVMCSWCGIHIAHRQWREHVQVCLGAYTQASVATATTQASVVMAISQASAQGHAVASAMMTQEQWYQQPYQQYYQNYIEDYMQQQPMQRQSFAPHDQVIYVQAGPAVHYEADQTHSQMLPQPQVQSQSLAMHQPHDAFPSPQDNTVQDSPAQNTVSQCLSNQPHASGNVVQNPQLNQTNQVGVPPNNMIMHDEDNFLEQVSRVRLPQSLPTIQMEQNPLPSQLTRDQHTNQTVLKYGGALAPESSDMHSSQQPFSIPSLSQQHRATSTTGAVHNQMNHEGPSYHPHIALQEHQLMSPILGVQPNMNHFSATAPEVSLPAVKRMTCTGSESSAAEVTTIKFDHKLKGNLSDGSAESVHRSSIVVEGGERKSGPLGKQVVEEDVGNGWVDLGRSLLVEQKSINNDPSLDGIPQMNPTLLNRDGLRQLRNRQQHCSAGSSLDRGFDQRSSIRTQEKHETGFELRSSQPSMDFGERQFRHGPRSSIHEHHEMPSHGYGPSGGIGNLQEKVIAADMIGPVDSNGLRLGDVGSHQSRYTLQGYPGDGGSFPVKILEDWTTKPVESLDFHSQTKEHQQNSMDMVSMIKHNEKKQKQKMSPSDSSQFGLPAAEAPKKISGVHKRCWKYIPNLSKTTPAIASQVQSA